MTAAWLVAAICWGVFLWSIDNAVHCHYEKRKAMRAEAHRLVLAQMAAAHAQRMAEIDAEHELARVALDAEDTLLQELARERDAELGSRPLN